MLTLLCFIDLSQFASHLSSKSKHSGSFINLWVTFYIYHDFDFDL